MTLEFRPKGREGSLELHDETGKIGEIQGPEDEPTDPPIWVVELWSLTGSGKTWGNVCYSLDDAKQEAEESYVELVAERREAAGGRSGRAVPTPMGGQPRRR